MTIIRIGTPTPTNYNTQQPKIVANTTQLR